MTMLSFRVGDDVAVSADWWARTLKIDRSELLRDALRAHLARLAAERDVEAWEAAPLDESESSLGAVADWGPAEEWSDWADATG